MSNFLGGVYSFMDVQATIVGPGGAFSLGYGSGNSEEGIEIEPSGDKNTMTIGADGTAMHSLLADKSGKVTVRLLKTSPVNALLQGLYDAQSLTSLLWGKNVISIVTLAGDSTSCRACAFAKKPTIKYAKEGGMNEWVFDSGYIDSVLGVF